MNNLYVIVLLSSIVFLGCTSPNDNNKIEIEKSITISSQDTLTRPNISSETSDITKVAQSFSEWYQKAENKSYTQHDYPFTAKLVRSKDGDYNFDLEPYFKELRKLGTISDKFLQSERGRFSKLKEVIDTYYPTPTDSDYVDIYNDCVDDFYYYRMSQDALYSHTDVVSVEVSDDDKTAVVILSLVPEHEGTSAYAYPQAEIELEKESDKWMIVKITQKD